MKIPPASVLRQLESYAAHAAEEGWYYGNKFHFDNRHKFIMDWLNAAIAQAETKKRKEKQP